MLLQVFVLDTFRQRVIFDESYHSEADWPYDSHYRVDTSNSLFWRSDFGRMVLNTVNAAVSDVSSAIACEPTFARIVNIYNQQYVVDMGASHGITTQDSFQLYKQQSLPVLMAPTKSVMLPVEEGRLSVTHIGDEVSIISNEGIEGALQLFDIVAPIARKSDQ